MRGRASRPDKPKELESGSHMLGSSFVPASALMGTGIEVNNRSIEGTSSTEVATRDKGVTQPREDGHSSVDIVVELSKQFTKHLGHVVDELRANGRALTSLQDSVAELSKQIAGDSSEWQHLKSAMEKFGSHIKEAKENQLLSSKNLDRINSAVHWSDTLEVNPSTSPALTDEDLTLLGKDHALHKVMTPHDAPKALPECGPITSCPKTPNREINTMSTRMERAKESSSRTGQLAVFCAELRAMKSSDQASNCRDRLLDKTIAWLEWFDDLEEPRRRGRLADLVCSQMFEMTFGCAIILQAVAITYTVNQDMANPGQPFSANFPEWFFLVVFSMEVILRLVVHQLYFFIGTNSFWNIFDTVLVISSLYMNFTPIFLNFDTSNFAWMGSLRTLKILRVLKVLRVVRLLPGIEDMLSYLYASGLQAVWSFFMMSFCFYAFALMLVQDLASSTALSSDPELLAEMHDVFGNVGRAMFTLFRSVFNGDDWDKYYRIIAQTDLILASVGFVFFVCLVQIVLANIVTVAFFVSVSTLAKQEKSKDLLANEETVKYYEQCNQIRKLCEKLDRDDNNSISRKQLLEAFEDDRTCSEFTLMGLDIKDVERFFDLLLSLRGGLRQDQEVDIDSFVEACMRMKGGATGIEQHMQLLEARNFQRKVFDDFYKIKIWQFDLTRRLQDLGALEPNNK